MADKTIKSQYKVKNKTTNAYDVYHFETSSDQVAHGDSTVAEALFLFAGDSIGAIKKLKDTSVNYAQDRWRYTDTLTKGVSKKLKLPDGTDLAGDTKSTGSFFVTVVDAGQLGVAKWFVRNDWGQANVDILIPHEYNELEMESLDDWNGPYLNYVGQYDTSMEVEIIIEKYPLWYDGIENQLTSSGGVFKYKSYNVYHSGNLKSLPANGGNADTVDNKHASDFAGAATVNNEFKMGKYMHFYDYDDAGSESTKKKAYLRDGVLTTEFTDLKLGSSFSIKAEIDTIKASSGTAITSGTVLAWANGLSKSASKFQQQTFIPTDKPSSAEGLYECLVGIGGRKIVRFTQFNTATAIPQVWVRDVYNSAWLNSWRQIDGGGGSSKMKTSITTSSIQLTATSDVINKTSAKGGHIELFTEIASSIYGSFNIWIDGVQIATDLSVGRFNKLILESTKGLGSMTFHYTSSIRIQYVKSSSGSGSYLYSTVYIHENQ